MQTFVETEALGDTKSKFHVYDIYETAQLEVPQENEINADILKADK